MAYDFDSIIDRRGTGSLKWDVAENELPMWVADMDFPAAPEIREAIAARAAQGVFGYNILPDEWYDAYIRWWGERHGFAIERDWLIFSAGVIPSLSSSVRRLSAAAEGVIVQTPVYNHFFTSIENNGRRVIENPLRYENGHYETDFEDLERRMRDPLCSLMILCNPHNPTGQIRPREELMRIATLAHEHHVTVISDEIHCDLTDPDVSYVPYATVSDYAKWESITAVAPTKAFNLAGIQSSALIIPNPVLRAKVDRQLNTDEVAEPNTFAVPATVAAFNRGGAWLDELRAYICENKRTTAAFIEKELPQITLVPSNATYLLWLDCGTLTDNAAALAAHIRRTTGLFVIAGNVYRGNGKRFLRLNIACPRETLLDGLARLKRGIENFR